MMCEQENNKKMLNKIQNATSNLSVPFSHLMAALTDEEIKWLIEVNLERLIHICKTELILLLQRFRHILEKLTLQNLLEEVEVRVINNEKKRKQQEALFRSLAKKSLQEFFLSKIPIAQSFQVVRVLDRSVSFFDIVAQVQRKFTLKIPNCSEAQWSFHFTSQAFDLGGPKDVLVELSHALFLAHCRKKRVPEVLVQLIFRFALPIFGSSSFIHSEKEANTRIADITAYWKLRPHQ
jgi:hypothetical protein